MEPEVCKIGIPVNSIETYMKKIEEKEYSYIVYYFNQQTNRLEVIKKYTGKNKNTETNEKKNCYICQNTVKVYKKPDKYIVLSSLQIIYLILNKSVKKTEIKNI